MSTTDLQNLQTATPAVAPRPKAAIAPVCNVGSWLATSRLSMTVPAFHDRRPLCSTT